MRRARPPADPIAARVDYWTLAELRYHIRRFLRVREDAARAAGIEPQRYQVLLQIKGGHRDQLPTVGMLAERLQLRHHSTVELIDRLVDRDMLARRQGGRDRREVVVELRPAGEAVLKRLALYSLHELEVEGPALVGTLRQLIGRSNVGQRGDAGRLPVEPSQRRRGRDGRTAFSAIGASRRDTRQRRDRRRRSIP